MKNRNPNRKTSIPAAVMTGGGAALIWALLCAVLAAKLIEGESLKFEYIGYTTVVIHLTAGAIAGAIAWSVAKKSRLPVSLGAGCIYYLGLMSITALFFGGIYTGMGITAVLIAVGAVLPALPGLMNRGGKRTRHYKIRHA